MAFHPVGRNIGILGISFWKRDFREIISVDKAKTAYLTSRGVPALLRIFTTACTPLAASKERSADGESTRTHRRVSRMMDVRCGVPFDDFDFAFGESDGVERCREASRRSSKICNGISSLNQTATCRFMTYF